MGARAHRLNERRAGGLRCVPSGHSNPADQTPDDGRRRRESPILMHIMAEAVPLDHLDLPYPRTRLIGREAERASARASLIEEATPLLSLTGPGGVGKTRLALAIASDVAALFADGVAWVDRPRFVIPRWWSRRSRRRSASRHQRKRPWTSRWCASSGHARCCSSWTTASISWRALAPWWRTCSASVPRCRSWPRAALRCAYAGERVLLVDPLPLPASDALSLAAIAGNDAVRLFVERARDAWPAFRLTEVHAPSVAAICRALDGLPLAIELAAARITVLSPSALLAQMTHRLALLGDGPRDAPTRQHTLTATISWSYELLTANDQELFRRLTVFRGGFTLAAAQVVAGHPQADEHEHEHEHEILLGLSRLVDHSLHLSNGCGRRRSLLPPGDDPRLRLRTIAGERRSDANS